MEQLKNERKKKNLRDLTDNKYLKVSYPLLLHFDHRIATYLSILIHLEIYNEKKKFITPDGYFLAKRKHIQDQIGLTKRQQEVVCKDLIDMGLISYKKTGSPVGKGTPHNGYVRLNHAIINNVLDNCKFEDVD